VQPTGLAERDLHGAVDGVTALVPRRVETVDSPQGSRLGPATWRNTRR
jgi:hypothetical protein